MDFLIGFFLGILLTSIAVKIVTWWTIREIQRRGLARILADLEKESGSESFQENVVALRVERHQDSFLFFDAATQQFVTQGRNYQEVSETLKQMFQDRTVAITEGTAEDIKQFRATQAP
jgi:hypothetical protein